MPSCWGYTSAYELWGGECKLSVIHSTIPGSGCFCPEGGWATGAREDKLILSGWFSESCAKGQASSSRRQMSRRPRILGAILWQVSQLNNMQEAIEREKTRTPSLTGKELHARAEYIQEIPAVDKCRGPALCEWPQVVAMSWPPSSLLSKVLS